MTYHALRSRPCLLTQWALRLIIGLSLPAYIQATTLDASQPPIRVGHIISSLPWTDHNANPPSGIGIELLTVVFRELGTPIEIALLPPSRLLAQLNNGSLQAASVVDEGSATLSKALACSNDILNIPFGIYLKSDSNLLTHASTPKALWPQLNTGVLRFSYIGTQYMEHAGSTSTFENSAQLFRSLKAGRINAANSPPLIAKYWQKTLDLKLKPLLHLHHLGAKICFSRKHLGDTADDLARKFDLMFFHILDNQPKSFSTEALHAFLLFDARKPPKTVLDIQ